MNKPTYNITIGQRSGTWYYQIQIKDGTAWKYHSSKSGFAKQAEAKKASQKVIDDLKLQPEAASYTLQKITDMYITRGNKAPGTISSYKSWAKNFGYLLEMPIVKIKKINAEEVLDLYQAKHMDNGTATFLSFARSVFRYAIDTLEVDMKNPFSSIKLVRSPDKAPKDIRVLHVDEIHVLIGKLTEMQRYDIALLTALMGLCGLRIGEARGLTREFLNLSDKTLEVRKQRLHSGDITKRLKTTNSKRTVPIPDSMLHVIMAMPTPLSKTALYIDEMYTSDTTINIYNSIGYDLRPHELRHSYATNLIERGVDYKTISTMIGDSLETVIRTYSHVNNNMMDAAVKIARAF